jgi:transcriptional regulator with XRE-family HTH domain
MVSTGKYIQMNVIGSRLREERDRLGLSQAAFGEIGGVKANAQGIYEKGDRYPDASYLNALAAAGVDVLYVITGDRTPLTNASISPREALVIERYRMLPEQDQLAVDRLTSALAETAGRYSK